ncbi:MAG: glycosyltransferase family 2 protein, partial [Lachnospiraceae bacterium]|nr:glycosyltransferase family 2 protein [Lachnospiraceae bacterium]
YQRLDYMLHIPVPMMTGKNDFYLGVKSYLRKHLWDTVINPYLTGKKKVYLLLLTLAPKTVRRVHERLRGMRRM